MDLPDHVRANFCGESGRGNLIAALRRQHLLADVPQAMGALAEVATIEHYPVGRLLIEQGAYDADVFHITRGEVGIVIGVRQVAGDAGELLPEEADVAGEARGAGGVVVAESCDAAIRQDVRVGEADTLLGERDGAADVEGGRVVAGVDGHGRGILLEKEETLPDRSAGEILTHLSVSAPSKPLPPLMWSIPTRCLSQIGWCNATISRQSLTRIEALINYLPPMFLPRWPSPLVDLHCSPVQHSTDAPIGANGGLHAC